MEQELITLKQYVLAGAEERYHLKLKSYIIEKREKLVKYVIDNVYIPDNCLSYDVLSRSSKEIIVMLLTRKQNLDNFVESVISNCKVLDIKSSVTVSELIDVLSVANLYYEFDYSLFFIENLCKHVNDESLSILNININYKNNIYIVNKLFCDALYNANHKFVIFLQDLIINLNIKYKFDPNSRSSHQQILQWIMLNVKKAEKNERVGWRSGPDSGTWPSSDPEDYKITLSILQDLMQ